MFGGPPPMRGLSLLSTVFSCAMNASPSPASLARAIWA